jgi:hypothetical protein
MPENNKTLSILLIAFVALVFGVIAVQVISQQSNLNTEKVYTTETLTIDNTNALINATFINQSPIYLSTNSLQSGFRTDYSECEVTALDYVTNNTGVVKPIIFDFNFTKASGSTRAYITIAKVATDDTTEKDWIDLVGTGGNKTTVGYTYCPNNYIGGWGGTIQDMVPGFFALGVLGVALLFALYVFREQGLF